MSTVGISLKDPFENGRVPSEAQLKAYSKAYKELKSEILAEDKEFCNKQTQKLKESLESLKDIKGKASSNRGECQNKIAELRKQSLSYEKVIAEYDTRYKNTNKQAEFRKQIADLQKQHLSNCKHRVEIASGIDVYAFRKLDIEERKADAHQLFKWMLVALYSEPESKYYWPNFQEQAIETDKGVDLQERLGKIQALNAKEEQRVRTAKFLEQYQTILKAPQLQKYTKQVQSIHQIAKLFYASSQAGRKIRDLNKQIEKSREAFRKDDQERLQNSKNNNAILERIRVSEAYLKQLKAMEELLASRVQKYDEQIAAGEAYAAQIGKLESYVVEYKAPAESGEKRDICECNVY